MQVRLPDAWKANTQEAGADVKESGLCSGASNLENGASHLKAHLLGNGGLTSESLSGGRGVFEKGEGKRTKRSREGVAKFSWCRRAWSIPIRPMTVRRASSWFSQPDSMSASSTDEGQQISWSWDT